MATPPAQHNAPEHMTSVAISNDILNMRMFMDIVMVQDSQTGHFVFLNLARFQQAVIARGWRADRIQDLARFHRLAVEGRQWGLTPTQVVLRMHDEMAQQQSASPTTAPARSNPATPNKRRRDEQLGIPSGSAAAYGAPSIANNPFGPQFGPEAQGVSPHLQQQNQGLAQGLYGIQYASMGNSPHGTDLGNSHIQGSYAFQPHQAYGGDVLPPNNAFQAGLPSSRTQQGPAPTTPRRQHSNAQGRPANVSPDLDGYQPIAPSLGSSPQPGAFSNMYAANPGSSQGQRDGNVGRTTNSPAYGGSMVGPQTPTHNPAPSNIQIITLSPSRRGNLSGFRGVRGEQGTSRGRSGRGHGSIVTSQDMGAWPGMVPSTIPSSQSMPNLHGSAGPSQVIGNTDDLPPTPSKRQRTGPTAKNHHSEVDYPAVEYDENGRVRTGLSQTPPAADQRQTAHIDLTQDDDDEPIGAPTGPPQIQQEDDLGNLQYEPLSEYGDADLFADLFDEPVSQDDGHHAFLPATSDVEQVGGIVQHAESLESEVVQTPASAAAASTPGRSRIINNEGTTPTTDITTPEAGPSAAAGTPDIPVDLENWTAKLLVNSDQVGTFSSEGMKLFKKTMYADGPVVAANGTSFVQGKLTVSRPTVTQLRIAGAEAGETNAETMEPYNVYVKKNAAPCKELKFVVTPGAYTIWRDDVQIGQGMHETARNAKNLTLRPDGSYAVVPPHQMLTFEEWHDKSDLQLMPDNIVDLDRFPKLPPQINRCADCRLYKSPHNQTSTLGFEVGACEHDIKEFLWWSEMSKQMPSGALGPHGANFKGLVAHEQRRMGAVKWNLVQDDAVRTRLQEVAAEYVRLLGESLLLLR